MGSLAGTFFNAHRWRTQLPRQSNGVYVQPANTAAVSAQTISSTAFNTLETDIGSEITNSLDRGGRSAMTAALPMGSNKITGMADPTVATDAATKNYVDTSTAAFFSTGDGKLTLKTVADTGWILCDDGTFGSASSGSSNRANVDTLNLFTLFFNNLGDTGSPLLTSGGGATTRAAQVSASAAWAANCRMTLSRQLGRAIAIAGTGAGLTGRTLGGFTGEETHLLTLTEIPTGITSTVTETNGRQIPATTGLVGQLINAGSSTNAPATNNPWNAAALAATSNNTGGGAHNNVQPTSFWNVMIKL